MDSSGFIMEVENASGVNLLVNEEERNELPNLVNDGEGTLPSISIDFLQHYNLISKLLLRKHSYINTVL